MDRLASKLSRAVIHASRRLCRFVLEEEVYIFSTNDPLVKSLAASLPSDSELVMVWMSGPMDTSSHQALFTPTPKGPMRG